MKHFLFLCIFLFSLSASAQKFEISGQIVDQKDSSPLESATVFVEQIADSTLVSYTITDKNGNFKIEGSSKEEQLRLIVSYAGYAPVKKLVSLDKPVIDLGQISMAAATNELGEVMVVADRAPVTVKSDTLEFNAGSFSTRPDANLEDLMKKLPGVEVDTQGNITVNGKPVSRILVNGKEFFGTDPKIATKNLPKEIIDKIQVVNTKTKTEEFTGKAGNPDDKTINITIKDDKNHGYFARATLGGGTDGRYEFSGIGNYFKDEMRVSVLASSNNINSAGFSFDEVFDMMGSRARSISISNDGGFSINGNSFGAGEGITKSETAGFNFTDEWAKKYEVNADYFFGRNDTETRTEVQRENFLPERTYYQNSISEGNLQNDSHRASASFEVEFDTLTKLSFRPELRINDGFSSRSRVAETFDENRQLSNSSSTENNGDLHSTNFSNRLNFIKRFGSRGAYLQAYVQNENERQENENYFLSDRRFYENGEVTDTQLQDQYIDEQNQDDEYRLGFTQRLVMADKLFLDLSYDFSTENSSNERNVYDFEETTGAFTSFNDLLSNSFEVKSVKHIPNAGINYEGEKWRLGLDVGYLSTSLENTNNITETGFKRNFENLYLSSNLRYEIKRGASLYLYYRNDTEIPSIREMQPVADISDPLNIVVGNPNLNPTFSQNFNFGYRNFDFATRSGFSTYAGFTLTNDQVVPFTTTSEDFVSTTTYTNVDGGIRANLGSYYNKRIKKDSTEYNFRLGGNVNYNKQIGFSNEVKYHSDRISAGPSIRLGYNYNDLIEINPSYNFNYVFSDYSISNNREVEYMNHSVGLEATSYWPKNFVYGNDISYNYYGNVSPGFDPTSILWNMSLGYKFLNDDATFKVKVYDLLNENVSTSRSTGQDYVQDTEQLILEQYVMFSLTYKLSKFGGKDPNRRGGGIIMF